MGERRAWETNIYDITYNTIDEIIENILNGNISYLKFKDTFKPGMVPNNYFEESSSKKNTTIIYTDALHPYIKSSFDDEEIMNPQFFQEHREEIIKAFIEKIKKKDRKYYQIPNYLYSEELLDILLSIKDVSIDFYDVNLSREAIDKIKNSFIDATLKTNGKEEVISSKFVIDGTNITKDQISDLNEISIPLSALNTISDSVINMINNNCDIRIYHPENDEENYYKNVYGFIERLDNLGKNCTVSIDVDSRRVFKEVFKEKRFKNVNLVINTLLDAGKYTYEEYLQEEKRLEAMISHIHGKPLSPAEKFSKIFDVVKKFKKYRHSTNGREEAIQLKHILNNEFIVCRGYAALLKVLCDKEGINVDILGIDVDMSYDNDKSMTEKSVERGYHARCLVTIDDPKYNIHGIYMSDPTWDSDLEDDYYNHMLMTFDSTRYAKRMVYFDFSGKALDIHSFKEFNDQVNFILRHRINNSDYSGSYEEIILHEYGSLVDGLVKGIKTDPKYNYYYSKCEKCITEKDYEDLLTEFGNYLVGRVNKKIDDKVILQVVFNANSILNQEMNREKIIRDYYEQQQHFFPYEIDEENEHNLVGRSR